MTGYPNIISKTYKCYRCERSESFHSDMQYVTHDVVSHEMENIVLDGVATAKGWELEYAKDCPYGDAPIRTLCNTCYHLAE